MPRPPSRNGSSPARTSATYLVEKTLLSPQIFTVRRTFSVTDPSRPQMNCKLLPRTGLNASRNLFPRLRFDVCRTSFATYRSGRWRDGDEVWRADRHSDTAVAAPPGLS